VTAVVLMVGLSAGTSAGQANTFYWYGGSPDCWAIGATPAQNGSKCDVGSHATVANESEPAHNGIGADLRQTFGKSGDYCHVYNVYEKYGACENQGATWPLSFSTFGAPEPTNETIAACRKSNGAACGAQHYVAFNEQEDYPWSSSWFETEPALNISAELALSISRASSTWAYLCPVFKAPGQNDYLEYCFDEYQGNTTENLPAPPFEARGYGLNTICASANINGVESTVDQVVSPFAAGSPTPYGTTVAGSASTGVGSGSANVYLHAKITDADLLSAIQRDNLETNHIANHEGSPEYNWSGTKYGCHRGISQQVTGYKLVGIEDGVEGRPSVGVNATTQNLKAWTEYSPTFDENGDGWPDLLWYYAPREDLQVLFGEGNTFNNGISEKPAAAPTWAGIGDVNGDGKADVVWYYESSHDLQVLFGDGSAFNGGISHKTVGPLTWAALADVNGDGRADLILYYASTEELQVLLSNGTSFEYSTMTHLPPPTWAGVADVNGDGRPDVIWYTASNSNLAVHFGDGRSFNGGESDKSAGKPDWAGIGDVNGDGKPDVIWYYAATHDLQVLFGDGSSFNGGISHKEAGTPTWSGVEDVNRDGKADVLWYYAERQELQVLFSDGGSFTNAGITKKGAGNPDMALPGSFIDTLSGRRPGTGRF
jgi:hypothetical protein